jgi:hypothetical protein
MADGMVDFLAGTIGGFAGKLFDYPFDTVKVLLQTQDVVGYTGPKYTGALHCLRHTVDTSGVSGLYKGISSPLLGSMAENAVLFWSYGIFKTWLGSQEAAARGEDLSIFQLSLAGAGAGAIVPCVLTPVELIKCRLQVQNSINTTFRPYAGPIDCLIQTVRREGIAKGLYKGNGAMLLREIPGNFAWYGVYEGTCKLCTPAGGTKKDLGPEIHLLGGAMSGVTYWTAFYPADTVKSYIQTDPRFTASSLADVAKEIWREHGVAGLYRGWGVTVLRAAPAHALIFACYEAVSARLTQT